jgi:hypothetical protein
MQHQEPASTVRAPRLRLPTRGERDSETRDPASSHPHPRQPARGGRQLSRQLREGGAGIESGSPQILRSITSSSGSVALPLT